MRLALASQKFADLCNHVAPNSVWNFRIALHTQALIHYQKTTQQRFILFTGIIVLSLAGQHDTEKGVSCFVKWFCRHNIPKDTLLACCQPLIRDRTGPTNSNSGRFVWEGPGCLLCTHHTWVLSLSTAPV